MFDQVYKMTMKHEGKYSNHFDDRGGETYMGISRKFHPTWKGWNVIDTYANKNDLKYSIILPKLVKNFYKENYWKTDRLNLEYLSEDFPQLTLELFDVAVNMGVYKSAKILQRALNILNRDEKNYDNLIIDGYCGKKTFSIVDKYKDNYVYLKKMVILFKAKHYIDLIESNESQEVFLRGWINRINF